MIQCLYIWKLRLYENGTSIAGFLCIIVTLYSFDFYYQLSQWSEECWGDSTAKQKTPGSWNLPFVVICALKWNQDILGWDTYFKSNNKQSVLCISSSSSMYKYRGKFIFHLVLSYMGFTFYTSYKNDGNSYCRGNFFDSNIISLR